MLTIDLLPSLREIAETIISGDDSGQLILFCFPSKNVWLKWKDFLVTALSSCLSEAGRPVIDEIIQADILSDEPQKDLADKLSVDDYIELDEILASYGGASPIVLELLCEGSLPVSWQKFIYNVARFFREQNSVDSKRSICLFLIAPPKLPPVKVEPGVRCFSFWNPLKWEEIRILVEDNLEGQEDVMAKSWFVSTYTGASNSDPELISALLAKLPRSLEDVKNTVLKAQQESSQHETMPPNIPRFFEEKRWDVPAGMADQWLKDQIHGNTLDRGSLVPWGKCPNNFLDSSFMRVVWREQVAGLYPLLMEVSFLTAEMISNKNGNEWKKYAASKNNGMCLETEPGEILRVFRENKDLKGLPLKSYELLQNLRIARNKLAHLEPVDFKDVRQIWALFERALKK